MSIRTSRYPTQPAEYRIYRVIFLSMLMFVLGHNSGYTHGSMEVPVSRVYNCFLEGPENPQSEACKAAVREGGTQALYDWNGVNSLADGRHRDVIPDGNLCSAGKESHKGLDLARDDWRATLIAADQNGNFEFVFWPRHRIQPTILSFISLRTGTIPLSSLGGPILRIPRFVQSMMSSWKMDDTE